MTDDSGPTRRARIATAHEDADVARRIAASVEPDNTAEMATRIDGERVVTTVDRSTTGGLRSTLDDYVVNATVAARLATGTTPTDGDEPDADARDDENEPDADARDDENAADRDADANTADTDTDT